jgi:hypothetical protein
VSYPTRYPGATWRPVPHHSPGMVLPPRGLIPHLQMGGNSLAGWFSNARSGVSSHLWVSRAGDLEQYVDLTEKAWAQAAGNPYWISCECEGATEAEDYTPAQIARLGEIYRWGMAIYGWPPTITDDPGGRGLGTHRMGGAAWGGHSCPGDLRASRRRDILAAALGHLPTPEEPDVPLTDDDVARVSARLRADLMADVLTAADAQHPIRQGSAGQTLGSAYLKAGDLQSRIASIEAFLGGAFAEWTGRQDAALAAIQGAITELRGLLTGGTVAGVDPAAVADIAGRLDALLTAFAAPRAYTLTPGPAVAQ